MISEGASFLDLGGYSSRPGAADISEEEELERIIPAISEITKAFPDVNISVDTFRSQVAKKAVESGAVLVNDISGGLRDPNMLATVAQLQVPYIMMHMRGTPQTMKSLSNYENVTHDVLYYFSERVAAARKAGINDLILIQDSDLQKQQSRALNFSIIWSYFLN